MRRMATLLAAVCVTGLMGCAQPACDKAPAAAGKNQPTTKESAPAAKPQPAPAKTEQKPAALKAVYRINAGGEKDFTDEAGQVWSADREYSATDKFGAEGGSTVDRPDLAIPKDAKARQMYLSERYSMTAYRFDVPNGKYAVRMHFAESFEDITAAEMRVFTVKLNGKVVLKDFDPFKEAGGFAKPVVKEFKDVAVTDGKIRIEFEEKTQNPQICGIEILQ